MTTDGGVPCVQYQPYDVVGTRAGPWTKATLLKVQRCFIAIQRLHQTQSTSCGSGWSWDNLGRTTDVTHH